MGWRFRKSFKILPGVKLNINKKSVGLTFGGKGFHYTVNSKGKHTASAGIPGTGLYYTESYTERGRKGSSNLKATNNDRMEHKSGCLPLSILFFGITLFGIVLIGGVSSTSNEETEVQQEATVQTEATKQIMYATANLNVRSGPGTDYSILTTLKSGQEISVLNQSDGWAEIEYTPSPAYVSTSYISPDQPVEETVDEGPMVWVSYYGKKYHSNPYCSGMKGPTEMSLKDAQDIGKTPCSKCY